MAPAITSFTRMTQDKMSFEAALKLAQELGYAEADPGEGFDIDGKDAAHKAAVLASLSSGGCVNFRHVHVEGIRQITAEDIGFANQLGYEIAAARHHPKRRRAWRRGSRASHTHPQVQSPRFHPTAPPTRSWSAATS